MTNESKEQFLAERVRALATVILTRRDDLTGVHNRRHFVAVAESSGDQWIPNIDLDDSHVRFPIDADDATTILLAGLQTHNDASRSVNYVFVSKNVALGTHDETAADTASGAASLPAKHVEQGIVGRLIVFAFAIFVGNLC